jgi:hypothetical protein
MSSLLTKLRSPYLHHTSPRRTRCARRGHAVGSQRQANLFVPSGRRQEHTIVLDVHDAEALTEECPNRDRVHFLPPDDKGCGRISRSKEAYVPELFGLLLERVRRRKCRSRPLHARTSHLGGRRRRRRAAENILHVRGVRSAGHAQEIGSEPRHTSAARRSARRARVRLGRPGAHRRLAGSAEDKNERPDSQQDHQDHNLRPHGSHA